MQNHKISCIAIDEKIKMLEFILEKIKPDYNIATIKTIRDAVLSSNKYCYPVIKYLNEYIGKKEKEMLQKIIRNA